MPQSTKTTPTGNELLQIVIDPDDNYNRLITISDLLSSVVDTALGTHDQTLTGDRLVTHNANTLTFDLGTMVGADEGIVISGDVANGPGLYLNIGGSSSGEALLIQHTAATGKALSINTNSNAYGFEVSNSNTSSGAGGGQFISRSSAPSINAQNPAIAAATTEATILRLGAGRSAGISAGVGVITEYYLGGSLLEPMAESGYIMTDVTGNAQRGYFTFRGREGSTTITEAFRISPDGYTTHRNITAAQASAITAADGMIVYVTDTNGTFTSVGFWGRENGSWIKL